MRTGSWTADKFKDLSSLVKMSFRFSYTGAFVCVSSLSVQKPMGHAQMINQMWAKTVLQAWSVLHSYTLQGALKKCGFCKKPRGAHSPIPSPVLVTTHPTCSVSGQAADPNLFGSHWCLISSRGNVCLRRQGESSKESQVGPRKSLRLLLLEGWAGADSWRDSKMLWKERNNKKSKS